MQLAVQSADPVVLGEQQSAQELDLQVQVFHLLLQLRDLGASASPRVQYQHAAHYVCRFDRRILCQTGNFTLLGFRGRRSIRPGPATTVGAPAVRQDVLAPIDNLVETTGRGIAL